MNLLFHTEINFLINNNVTCPAIVQGKLFILILKLISVYVSCLLLPVSCFLQRMALLVHIIPHCRKFFKKLKVIYPTKLWQVSCEFFTVDTVSFFLKTSKKYGGAVLTPAPCLP